MYINLIIFTLSVFMSLLLSIPYCEYNRSYCCAFLKNTFINAFPQCFSEDKLRHTFV